MMASVGQTFLLFDHGGKTRSGAATTSNVPHHAHEYALEWGSHHGYQLKIPDTKAKGTQWHRYYVCCATDCPFKVAVNPVGKGVFRVNAVQPDHSRHPPLPSLLNKLTSSLRAQEKDIALPLRAQDPWIKPREVMRALNATRSDFVRSYWYEFCTKYHDLTSGYNISSEGRILVFKWSEAASPVDDDAQAPTRSSNEQRCGRWKGQGHSRTKCGRSSPDAKALCEIFEAERKRSRKADETAALAQREDDSWIDQSGNSSNAMEETSSRQLSRSSTQTD